MDDPALAEPYWCGPGGATGDHPAMASRWFQSVLALEIFWHLTDLPAAVINVSLVIFTGEDY
jgi:hypothetical protein